MVEKSETNGDYRKRFAERASRFAERADRKRVVPKTRVRASSKGPPLQIPHLNPHLERNFFLLLLFRSLSRSVGRTEMSGQPWRKRTARETQKPLGASSRRDAQGCPSSPRESA
jgi:hypothetical protein